MDIVLIILAVLACLLLGIIVLIQNPKGGGLTSNFSSSSQLMGVQKTGDFLEKGTWVLAITIMVLSLAINVALKGGTSGSGADNKDLINASKPQAAPAPANSAPLLPSSSSQQKAAPVKK